LSDIQDIDKTIQRTRLQEFSEHEVYLSFKDDQHALVFEEWLFVMWGNFVNYYETYPDHAKPLPGR
jgi:hypothetical protein